MDRYLWGFVLLLCYSLLLVFGVVLVFVLVGACFCVFVGVLRCLFMVIVFDSVL